MNRYLKMRKMKVKTTIDRPPIGGTLNGVIHCIKSTQVKVTGIYQELRELSALLIDTDKHRFIFM